MSSILDSLKDARRNFDVQVRDTRLPSGIPLAEALEQVRLLEASLAFTGVEKVTLKEDAIALEYTWQFRAIYITHSRRTFKIDGKDLTAATTQLLYCAPLAVLDQALLLLPRFMRVAARVRLANVQVDR